MARQKIVPLTLPQQPAKMARVERSSAGLRDAIFDEIDAIRNGLSSTVRANAVAKLASGVVETIRVELEVARYINQHPGQKPSEGELPGVPLRLGDK